MPDIDSELYETLEHRRVDIRRHPHVTADAQQPAIRLYCTRADEAWDLQIRDSLKRADGTPSKNYVIAKATLDRATMLKLRDAIDAQLERDAEFRDG